MFRGRGRAVPLPDVLARIHAAPKPPTLGLLSVTASLALSLWTWAALNTVILIVALQLATSPISAHLVARAAFRSDQLRRDLLTRDDLAENLTAAGFTATDWPVPDDDPTGRDTDVG